MAQHSNLCDLRDVMVYSFWFCCGLSLQIFSSIYYPTSRIGRPTCMHCCKMASLPTAASAHLEVIVLPHFPTTADNSVGYCTLRGVGLVLLLDLGVGYCLSLLTNTPICGSTMVSMHQYSSTVTGQFTQQTTATNSTVIPSVHRTVVT